MKRNQTSRRKSRRLHKSRRIRRVKKYHGGAMTPIESKPIVVAFFHGAITMAKEGVECNPQGMYTLKSNVQYMHVAHPGEYIMTDKARLKTFLMDPNSRKTTYEPMFDIHSMSDLTKDNAIYRDVVPNPPSNPKKAKSYKQETPFTGNGNSLFESFLRAKEGSTIPDARLTVHVPSEMEFMSLYVYYPNGTLAVMGLPQMYETLGLGPVPDREIGVKLSQCFEFLERTGIYDPSVGLGFIQISCNMFETDTGRFTKNLWETNTAFRKACHSIRSIWHIVDNEYRELDLLDFDEINKKYALPIVLPVVIPFPKIGVKLNEHGPNAMNLS